MLRKKGLIEQPRSLGQYLRNRQLLLGLSQEHVAQQPVTLREVYDRWERDERQPVVSEWPGILSFLGYYPATEQTAADLMLKARRRQGMDQKQLAQVIGVIHQRLRRWEQGNETSASADLSRLRSLATL